MKAFRTTRRGLLAAVAVSGLVQGVGTLTTSPFADASSGTMVATTAVNVRRSPNTNEPRLGLLRVGEKIEATGSSGGWTTVSYKGRTAYVASDYLRPASSSGSTGGTSQGSSGQVWTTANLNLRTGPGTNHSSVTVVKQGTSLGLTGATNSGWSQVRWNNRTLWASTRYLTTSVPSSSPVPSGTSKGRATARLMIRTSSGSNYRLVQVVPVGTVIDATGLVENGMAQVIWKNNVRWVNNRYFEPVSTDTAPTQPSAPSTTTRYATANLNIWAASTGSSYNGEIPRGSALQVTGEIRNGRAAILHNGVVKWVTARYTSPTAPTTTPPPTTGDYGDLNRGWSSGLNKTNPFVKRITKNTWDTFPEIKTQYGWRRDVTPDHPAGRAVDIMIPKYKTASSRALGNKIAEYYRAHHAEFNIHYIIWDQKIWNIKRDREGWRPMRSRGNDTANHKDHIHITTFDK